MDHHFEQVLKEIWTSLLGVEEISHTSDFLHSGGHPRLINQLLVAIKLDFNLAVTVREIAEHSRFDQQVLLLEACAQQHHQTSIHYWRNKLAGYQPVELTLGKPWHVRTNKETSSVATTLTDEVTRAINALAASCQTTVSMVLLATLYVFLERYCQQGDLIVGVLLSPQREKTINFRELLPVRLALSQTQSFREFINSHVKTTYSDACQHRIHPRLMSVNRSVQSLFNIVFVNTGHEMPDCDLALRVTHDATSLQLSFDYAAELYSDVVMKDVARNFSELLLTLCGREADPLQTIAPHWRTRTQPNSLWINDDEATILDRYRVQEHHYAQRDCIKLGETTVTAQKFWQTVWGKAEHLQQILEEHGLRCGSTETCIGIPSQRSLETLSDMAAILFAGAAFVPYDPNDPYDKKQFIFDDAHVQLCVVHGSAHLLSTNTVIPLKHTANSLPAHKVKPQHLAYIMYTSGTTGQPKGVRITHRALWHYYRWWASLHIHQDCQRIDFSGSLTFDASITTTLMALADAALIVICPEATKTSPNAFLDYLIESKIDLCKTTPSYFKLILHAAYNRQIEIPQEMKWLLIGEEMSGEDNARWLARYPHHTLYNAYGPTEATVFCSLFKIDRHNRNDFTKKVPIEKASRFARYHIVDTHMREVPYGVRGELCIEGPILADGYQNRPQETARAFLNRPDGEIWYRTGDQVMELTDGTIYFLGRNDEQIKIRGVRVELSAVKYWVGSHEDVADAAVLVKQFNEHAELVAFIVAKDKSMEKSDLCNRVRQHLLANVSASMTPHHYIALDHLPYNKAGKVDMERLRKIADQRIHVGGKMLVVNPLELSLLQIWQRSLKHTRIGTDVNFFNAGGNSLVAMEVMDAINRYLGISLRPDLIFQKPTIRELGQAISNKFSITNAYHISHAKNAPVLVMIHPATGSAHPYQLFRDHFATVDCYGISNDHFGENHYETIEAMARSYLNTVKAMHPAGPYFLGGYCTGGVVAFEMCRQLEQAGERPAGLVLLDSYNFDSLGTPQERDAYNKAQLSLMGFPEQSPFAQKMIRELDHNLELVVQYQPRFFSVDCLHLFTSEAQSDDNRAHLEKLRVRLNGWAGLLDLDRMCTISLATTHRGVFNNEQIIKCIAQNIREFVHGHRNRHDECRRKDVVY